MAPRARVVVVVAPLLCACAGTLRFSAVPPSHLQTEACSAPDAPPALTEPRFLPTLSGNLALVRATGDARLSAEGGIIAAWSPDSSVVAFSDHGAVSVWRAADGALLDLVRCVPGDLGANEIALSDDLRWVAVSGYVREPTDTTATCIVDRSKGSARIVPGETKSLFFDAASHTLNGALRTVDLESGQVEQDTPSIQQPMRQRPGAPGQVSPDGRYMVTSSECIAVELDAAPQEAAPTPSQSGPFVAITDLTTGKELWREPEGPCTTWRFSPDGRFLQKGAYSYGTAIRDARTGLLIQFPGGLLDIAPDGNRVIVLNATGPELWSLEPRAPIIGGARYRTVLARSRDGSVVAALDREQVVLEREGRCHGLAHVVSPDVFAFNQKGTEIYGVLGWGGVELRVWNARDGAVLKSLYVEDRVGVYPMPDADRVGFWVDGTVRLYDALRGRLIKFARPPRTRYSKFNEQGSWPIRDLHGDRADRLAPFVAATRTGSHVVGATSLGGPALTIWDLEHPERVVDMPLKSSFQTAALSPDERFVAAGDDEGTVYLWTRKGRTVALEAKGSSPVRNVAFSPNGRLLAAGFDHGTVMVFDTESGRVSGRLELPSQRASFLWWTADGTRLVIDTTRHLRFELAPIRR